MRFSKNVQFILVIFLLVLTIDANIFINSRIQSLSRKVQDKSIQVIKPVISPRPTFIPTPKLRPEPKINTFSEDLEPWGIAKQLDKYTWTMKVGKDERMGTPQEILDALNVYRERNGRGRLEWNQTLAEYAQSRSDFFAKNGNTDKHEGFNNYLKDENNYKKLGFRSLGENSSIGFQLLGVHLIEWVYAGDKPHNDNQLNSAWSHVGIGVTGTTTDLIFGGDKF